jgi:hypothetical protein
MAILLLLIVATIGIIGYRLFRANDKVAQILREELTASEPVVARVMVDVPAVAENARAIRSR